VDRRDPGAVGVHLPPQLLADAAAELVGGPLGEGEGEDSLDTDLLVERRGAVAVDEHGRLAGPGAGAQEDVAVAIGDGRPLLVGSLAHSSSSSSESGSSSGSPRSRRQIGWKVQ
jgi:hypothetical protein